MINSNPPTTTTKQEILAKNKRFDTRCLFWWKIMDMDFSSE